MRIEIETNSNPLSGEPKEGFPKELEPDSILWLTIIYTSTTTCTNVFNAIRKFDDFPATDRVVISHSDKDGEHYLRALIPCWLYEAELLAGTIAAEYIGSAICDKFTFECKNPRG